ncbi:MAG: hypothetical protein ABWK05_07020 [Pyrobaculum sp.]
MSRSLCRVLVVLEVCEELAVYVLMFSMFAISSIWWSVVAGSSTNRAMASTSASSFFNSLGISSLDSLAFL